MIDVVISIVISFGHFVLWTVIFAVIDETIRIYKMKKFFKQFEGSNREEEKRTAGEWRDD